MADSTDQGKMKLLLWVPALIGFALYLFTINHGFVLDDNLVLTQNVHVQEGFGGIDEILTTNYANGHQGFNDGLYRPISLISFAVEKSLFNLNPQASHFIQALLYAILLLALALWMRSLFDTKNLVWFWIALIFAVHPIHTEVVANLKSRDELFALLFLLFSLWHFQRWLISKENRKLVYSVLLFLCALFSKESAITFLALFPLLMILNGGKSLKGIGSTIGVMSIPALFFLGTRSWVLSGMGDVDSGVKSLLQNPLIYSDGLFERLLTGANIQALYITKLFLPIGLSHDYSYNAIEVSTMSDIGGWIWLLGILSFIVLGIYGLLQNKTWGFGILFYFVTISAVSNVLILIGAMAAERFVFAPSLGWAIAIVPLIHDLKLLKPNQKPLAFLIIVAGFFVLSYQRIPDWESNFTLFKADVEKVDNSARAHYNYGTALSEAAKVNPSQKSDYLNRSQKHLKRAIEIWPEYQDAYNNLGVSFIADSKFEEAYQVYSELHSKYPEYSKGIFNLAFALEKLGRLAEAELYYEQYESIVPDNNVLFVIIELEGQQGKFEEAIEHLNELVSREPNKGRGYMKLGMAFALQGQEATAATYFLKTTEIAPRNAEAYFNLGLVYINTGRLEEAYEVLNKCLDVDPNHERAINLIKQLQSGS